MTPEDDLQVVMAVEAMVYLVYLVWSLLITTHYSLPASVTTPSQHYGRTEGFPHQVRQVHQGLLPGGCGQWPAGPQLDRHQEVQEDQGGAGGKGGGPLDRAEERPERGPDHQLCQQRGLCRVRGQRPPGREVIGKVT